LTEVVLTEFLFGADFLEGLKNRMLEWKITEREMP